MREHEAQEAAARRNREDPRRDRFVFYAFDESAGMAFDAWDVAMRLRREDEAPRERERPRRRSALAPATPAASAAAVVESEPLVAPEPEPAWDVLQSTQVYDGARDEMVLEPIPPVPVPVPVSAAAGTEAEAVPVRGRRRFGLVRLWGIFVVLVGLAFIAAVLFVAIQFRDYTHLSTTTWGVGVAAGLVAVWGGFMLPRRRT